MILAFLPKHLLQLPFAATLYYGSLPSLQAAKLESQNRVLCEATHNIANGRESPSNSPQPRAAPTCTHQPRPARADVLTVTPQAPRTCTQSFLDKVFQPSGVISYEESREGEGQTFLSLAAELDGVERTEGELERLERKRLPSAQLCCSTLLSNNPKRALRRARSAGTSSRATAQWFPTLVLALRSEIVNTKQPTVPCCRPHGYPSLGFPPASSGHQPS
jgi:hypothetical protein